MDGDKIIQERKNKIINFFKGNYSWVFYLLLIALIILTLYIRAMPFSDHNGKPGLWDSTLNDYTLGPDLDPFLFLRYGRTIIQNGSLPQIDNLRNVPLGFDTSTELQMVSYMIVLTYRILNLFGTYSINYAASFMPLIFAALTTIAFFFFVREIFLRKNEKETYIKSSIIAIISTAFMVIIPAFLSRTIAGIPEKESVGFFFMFLSLYLFLRAWKCNKVWTSCAVALLAGISTGLMGLSWGGYTYLYVTMGLATLAAFLLNKVGKKEAMTYAIWLISSVLILLTFTYRFNILDFVFGLDTGISFVTLTFIIAHFLLWNTKLNQLIKVDRIKLPKNLISIIVVIVVGLIFILAVNPGLVLEKINNLNNLLLNPITGRWGTTVAENRQPYFTEWVSSFGKLTFWLFLIGSVVLFKETINKVKKRDAWILTLLFIFFLFGLIFSRYAPHPNVLDGEGFLSKLLYYGSALLFVFGIIYSYTMHHKENDDGFERIDYEFLLLFSLYILTLFTARSAVRLIMVLVPIAPIFLAYLIVKLGFGIKKQKDETIKVLVFVAFAVVAIAGLYVGFFGSGSYYQSSLSESYNYVPSYYTFQWQNAMAWVRTNTPENAVFSHWWDYGYWVQTMGNRATVTDGGNAIVWWNYLTGRFVLTGDNQKDALEFLHTHNASYLLIDSTDMGKYGAYSQIGSDANFDRFSQGPISFVSSASQSKETKNGTIRTYNNPTSTSQILLYPIEEDVQYNVNGTTVNLFKENTYLAGVTLKIVSSANKTSLEQPSVAFYSQGKEVDVSLRYAYYKNKLYDFKTGINAAIYIIQKIDTGSNGGLQVDDSGAAIYISPRVMRSLMAQVYLLDNSLGNFNNFQIVHSEPNTIINYLNSQSANLGEFVYYQGIQGPIKIWKINYNGDEKINPDYLLRSPPSYITWQF